MLPSLPISLGRVIHACGKMLPFLRVQNPCNLNPDDGFLFQTSFTHPRNDRITVIMMRKPIIRQCSVPHAGRSDHKAINEMESSDQYGSMEDILWLMMDTKNANMWAKKEIPRFRFVRMGVFEVLRGVSA